MINFLKEIFLFIKERKLLLIAPVIFILILVGILIFISSSSSVAPFIYTLF